MHVLCLPGPHRQPTTRTLKQYASGGARGLNVETNIAIDIFLLRLLDRFILAFTTRTSPER
jgi:hypothetical protein